MPPSANRVPRIKKPISHLVGAIPPPVRVHLLRLHIIEPGLFEICFYLLGSRPVWARHHGAFEVWVHCAAGGGPWGAYARVVGVCPGCDAQDSGGGEDAVELADHGAGVVCKVDDGAGEGVGDAGGRDALVYVSCRALSSHGDEGNDDAMEVDGEYDHSFSGDDIWVRRCVASWVRLMRNGLTDLSARRHPGASSARSSNCAPLPDRSRCRSCQTKSRLLALQDLGTVA